MEFSMATGPQHRTIGLVVIAAFLPWLASLPRPGWAETQIPLDGFQLDEPPVGNESFADVVVRSRIPRKFEFYNPHSSEQLRAIKAMGFTQVILDWPTLHAGASELGLDVVLAHWWTLKTEVKEIEKAVDFAKQVDRRRLVGFSMMDEPERYAPETRFEYYRSLYRDLRAYFDTELPAVQLEISHWGPLASWPASRYAAFVPLYQATDRIRLMPYPDLGEGPLSEVYYQMLRSRRIMELAKRPLPQVVILQTWMLPEEPKLPTIAELRVMAYSAMLGGADTISFYNYDPEQWEKAAPGFTAAFAELMRELTAFSNDYQGATVESQINLQGIISATIQPGNGDPVTVLVNTNREPAAGLEGLAVVVSHRAAAVATRPYVARHPGRRLHVRCPLLRARRRR
jgi:hypothetical protein